MAKLFESPKPLDPSRFSKPSVYRLVLPCISPAICAAPGHFVAVLLLTAPQAPGPPLVLPAPQYPPASVSGSRQAQATAPSGCQPFPHLLPAFLLHSPPPCLGTTRMPGQHWQGMTPVPTLGNAPSHVMRLPSTGCVPTPSLPRGPFAGIQHFTWGPRGPSTGKECRRNGVCSSSLQQGFYFSFLLTKNIEVVRRCQVVQFPVWVQRSVLCYNIPPQCLGDEGRASPTHSPSAPHRWALLSEASWEDRRMGLGQPAWRRQRGFVLRGCLISPYTLRGPSRGFAGLQAQSQHQTGN